VERKEKSKPIEKLFNLKMLIFAAGFWFLILDKLIPPEINLQELANKITQLVLSK